MTMDTVIELEIGRDLEPDTYTVRVLRSVGGGEPRTTFRLDVDELLDRRAALEDSVLSSSVAARRIVSPTEAAIQGVGRLLFDSVFTGEVSSAYRTSLAVASDRGKGVQVVLRLTAPGLAALPWEALFDAETGTYLCRKEPLVRQVPAPYSPPALAVDPPLRILGMISSPRGLAQLDVEHERALLEEALRSHLDAGRVRIDWIDEVTWPRVHDKLLEREWHVLHFIGHGSYDAETEEGVLAFVGRDGRADYVTASSLADLLGEADPSPRLVLLNSCLSGAGGADDLFSGTAAALVHSGIHAVAAMQYSISDSAAIEFARGFYSALAHGRGIDEAVRSGRIGILGSTRGTLEWVTPVLYLRGADTRLFDVAPMPEALPVRRPPVAPTADAVSPAPAATSTPSTTDAPTATAVSPMAAREPANPMRPHHAADSGDLPATRIPIVHMNVVPSDAAPPKKPAAAAAAVRSERQSPPPPSAPSRLADEPVRGRRRWAWLSALILVLALVVAAGAVFALFPPADGEQPVAEPTPAESTYDPPPTVEPPATTPRVTLYVPGRGTGTDTTIHCSAGEVLRLAATGLVDQTINDPEPLIGPSGYLGDIEGYEGVFDQYPPGALIGWLHPADAGYTFGGFADDGTGTYRTEYTCPIAGWVWLGVNDPVLDDNEGGFDVAIW
ncbi:MAG: CHAT domain-containing protein [Microbacterium sp.]